jgi:hypothetical protein
MASVHLLYSCFITNAPIQAPNYYELEHQPDKVQQLLTSLFTLKRLKFESIAIHISLDAPYTKFQGLVDALVSEWFPSARYSSSRLGNYGDWVEELEQIGQDCTWTLLINNHDHAFVCAETSEWDGFVDLLDQTDTDIAHISHWPEAVGWAALKRRKNRPPGADLGFTDSRTIGTVLLKTRILTDAFSSDFTHGFPFVRPDNPFGPPLTFSERFIPVPYTEFFRHLDGYGHVGLNSRFASQLRDVFEASPYGVNLRPWIACDLGEQVEGDLLGLPVFYSQRTAVPGNSKDLSRKLENLLYLATAYRVRWNVLFALMSAAGTTRKLKIASFLSMMCKSQFWCSLAAPVLTGFLMAKKKLVGNA